MQQDFDIIIIGGNIIGLTLACALADTPLKIAILDRQTIKVPAEKTAYDLRVYAISRASQNIFTAIGVWQDIISARVSPYRKMFVWDKRGQGSIGFDSRDIGEPNLGHIIEHQLIQAALLKKVQALSNVHCFSPVTLQEYIGNGKKNILLASDQKQFSGALVIGADGANSWVRQQKGITYTHRDYGHQAIVVNVSTELSHEQTAWQSFIDNGVLAFLPLADHKHCSIVWSTQDAARLMALSDTEFNQEITQAFSHRLGAVAVISKRLCFPLKMRHAKQYVKAGVALAGDAVRTIHPLAGQGLNLGLLDVAALTQVILKQYQAEKDFAAFTNLRKYERWRKGHNLLMIGLMDGLKSLFASQSPIIGRLRNDGLSLTNRFDLVKRLLIQQAMGIGGDLPVMAQR